MYQVNVETRTIRTPEHVFRHVKKMPHTTPTPSVDPPPARNGRTSAPTSHVTRAPHHVTRTANHVTNTAVSRPRPDIAVHKTRQCILNIDSSVQAHV